MSNLSESILKIIRTNKIKPTPGWVFLFKRSVIWTLFGISVLLGGIAVSLILFQINDADWEAYSEMKGGVTEFALLSLPYFWIVLMIGFLILAFLNFRHTKRGYRYGAFAIVGLSLIFSAIFGSVMYSTGCSEYMEESLVQIPHYEELHYGKRVLWQRPDQGFLSGTILQFDNGNILILQDIGKQAWWVDIGKARLGHRLIIMEGLRVKMIGEKMSEGKFRAEVISPWRNSLKIPPPLPQRKK